MALDAKPMTPAPPSAETTASDAIAGKRKKKYTSSLEPMQRGGDRVLKASRKLSRAVQKGLDEYYERADRSARKRRDGALISAPKDLARALGTTLRVASDIPAILVPKLRPRKVRRVFRLVGSLLMFGRRR